MMVYTIIVPIMPFVISALQQGRPPDSGGSPYDGKVENGGSTSQQTGVLLALFAAGLLIGSPILGYLGDRMTRRRIPMLLGILGLFGSTFLFLYGTQYWEFLVARFLQGFSDACVWTLGMCLIADTFPIETLGLQMGKVLLFHSVGLVAGAPVGALYQQFGYKAPFILCVALTGFDFLLRLFLVERRNQPAEWFSDIKGSEEKSSPTIMSNDETGIAEATTQTARRQVSTWQLLKHPRLLCGMLVAFAQGTVFNVFEPTLTVRLSTEWGFDSAKIGLVFLAQVIPTFVSAPMSGYLSDRFGPKIVTVPSMILCAIAVLLMGIPNAHTAGGVAPLIVLLAIQGGTAHAFVTPVLSEIAYVVQSQNPEGGDDGQGRSYALFNIAFGLGSLAGPLVGGFVYGAVGFFWLCIIIGCFLILCIPFPFRYMGGTKQFIIRKTTAKSLEAFPNTVNETIDAKEGKQSMSRDDTANKA
ncbi:major facilitator superfamily domain-containing protein [Radiomyces spectabilis]|uniref:major facilitator superfamily domain-containing protein n=1 Tax=Radiomyces spectabilis TaxID=64574 RepID=UPI002220DFAA|nr:major facilitator superfamily domain-containing protein [Radiomyces spectabilis]KAI8393496.1 major facilitator superfamily domain-containing protein [Radiomyces spectabilis]